MEVASKTASSIAGAKSFQIALSVMFRGDGGGGVITPVLVSSFHNKITYCAKILTVSSHHKTTTDQNTIHV